MKGAENEIKIFKESIEDLKLINEELKENKNQITYEKQEKEKEISILMDEIKRYTSEIEYSKNNKIT